MTTSLISTGVTASFPSPVVHAYHALGAVIACDIPLSDLQPHPVGEAAVTVCQTNNELPPPGPRVRVVEDGVDGEPLIRIFEGEDGIRYWARSAGSFWIAPSGKTVRYHLVQGACTADVEHLIMGPVFGLALQLQGRVLLHAGAVAVENAAVAFAGPHGFGKSTLTASFVRDGYPMMTDDVLPLAESNSTPMALPSLPRIKLWADSLAAFGESHDGYAPVVSWLDKRRVTVGEHWGRIAPSGLPLRALYLLTPHRDSARPIEISDLDPVTAALQVLANMYMAELLRGPRAARALDAAARLVSSIPVRRISYCRTYDRLPALREALLADARSGSTRA